MIKMNLAKAVDVLRRMTNCAKSADCDGDCEECKYEHDRGEMDSAVEYAANVLGDFAEEVHGEVIPRVYTPEEVAELPVGTDVWLENAPMPGYDEIICAQTVTGYSAANREIELCIDLTMPLCDYGFNTARGWRLWSRRPTAAECAAEPWSSVIGGGDYARK